MLRPYSGNTYREGPRHGIEANVHFVDEVGGVAHAHERTTRIDVILPPVQFFVVFQ